MADAALRPRSQAAARTTVFANEYGEPPIEFSQLGINVTVLEPARSGVYHAEANQEAFLLPGGGWMLLDDDEQCCRPSDFLPLFAPPGRALVGADLATCLVLIDGARLHAPVLAAVVLGLRTPYRPDGEKGTSRPEGVFSAAGKFPPKPPAYWPSLPWVRDPSPLASSLHSATLARANVRVAHHFGRLDQIDWEAAVTYQVASVDELQDIDYRQDTHMRPVRHHFGITAFGTNAWTAASVGDRLMPEHEEDEGSEELYIVLRGHARFEIDGARPERGRSRLSRPLSRR